MMKAEQYHQVISVFATGGPLNSNVFWRS